MSRPWGSRAGRAGRKRTRDPQVVRAYELMIRVRLFEEVQSHLWELGLISGELHTSIGEEAIVAGVVTNLVDGDAMAIDHRATGPLVARGVDMEALLLEVLGSEEGLCRGRGGHMHLFAPGMLAASDGIVGASAPLACGFALAARHLRPERVAVAFFGEGAANQGAALEAFNLAVAWGLPVLFVCKDNRWSVTTRTADMTGGSLVKRARAFGLETEHVDGTRVGSVLRAAERLIRRARAARGPGFLLATCHRPQGHFLGDPMLRMLRRPMEQMREIGGPLAKSALAPGGSSARSRAAAATHLGRRLAEVGWQYGTHRTDPVVKARRLLGESEAEEIEARARDEVDAAARAAVARAGVSGVDLSDLGGDRWRS